MVVVGADVHKRTHTFVAVDEVGRKLGEKVVEATTVGHRQAIRWARTQFGVELVWADDQWRGVMRAVLEKFGGLDSLVYIEDIFSRLLQEKRI